MKTIFALFDEYSQAEEALQALLQQDFTEEQMNAVALEPTAKDNMDVNLHAVDVQKSKELGGQTVHGLAHLFGGEQPVHVGGAGDLLAGGELATLLITQAASTGTDAAPLPNALHEFGVPGDIAAAFHRGIVSGGVLVWLRIADDSASAVASVLREQGGQHTGAYNGS